MSDKQPDVQVNISLDELKALIHSKSPQMLKAIYDE
jgi:hypothetical protein